MHQAYTLAPCRRCPRGRHARHPCPGRHDAARRDSAIRQPAQPEERAIQVYRCPDRATSSSGVARWRPSRSSSEPPRVSDRRDGRCRLAVGSRVTWDRRAKIAFTGSHGIRKTTAAHAFSHAMQRAGRSVEFGREVVRDNPLGINELATGEAQLWVLMSQVRRELELAPKAEVLVTDRGVVDNFAYYLRAAGGDPFSVEPLIRAWSRTYDLVVRLTPGRGAAAGRHAQHERHVPGRDRGDPGPDPAGPAAPRAAGHHARVEHHRRLRLVAARGAARGLRRGSRCWRGRRAAAPAASRSPVPVGRTPDPARTPSCNLDLPDGA